jgi:hypothetical protein
LLFLLVIFRHHFAFQSYFLTDGALPVANFIPVATKVVLLLSEPFLHILSLHATPDLLLAAVPESLQLGQGHERVAY